MTSGSLAFRCRFWNCDGRARIRRNVRSRRSWSWGNSDKLPSDKKPAFAMFVTPADLASETNWICHYAVNLKYCDGLWLELDVRNDSYTLR